MKDFVRFSQPPSKNMQWSGAVGTGRGQKVLKGKGDRVPRDSFPKVRICLQPFKAQSQQTSLRLDVYN